jgi:hypothetical protein
VVNVISARPTVHQVVAAELGQVDLAKFTFGHHDEIAHQLLTAVAERMREEIEPASCGCGGCDSCAQHALVDWLDPG